MDVDTAAFGLKFQRRLKPAEAAIYLMSSIQNYVLKNV